MTKKVFIGSRESKLAVVQSQMVKDYIDNCRFDIRAELVTMKTTGDKILDRTLDQIGGKGLFVKELDLALSEGRTQLSVHSLKDMPMEVPEELPLIGFSKREDPRDVLVLPKHQQRELAGGMDIDHAHIDGRNLEELCIDGPIGCSSMRRTLQLKKMYPDVICQSIRGNVQTRLQKLDGGQYGALVLAAAGLKRLGLEDRISRYFTAEEMLPAAGQGILAIQGKQGEDYSYLQGFFDPEARDAALAERAFVRELDGGCSSPVAAYAVIQKDQMQLTGLYYKEETETYFTQQIQGQREHAEELGMELARKMRNR